MTDDPKGNELLWSKLPRLDGMTKLGTEKPGATVLAVRGDNGELAVARTTKVIRQLFDQLEPQSAGTYYELMFPAYLPTGHGLELHQRLRKLLDAERARRLRNQLRARAARERRERRLAAQEQDTKAKGAI